MPRGKKKSHKGCHRQFTSKDDLALQAEKARKEQEWRSMKGLASDDDETEEGDEPKRKSENDDDDDDVIESGNRSDSEEEEESEEDEENKPKGVAHLIEIENPNRIPHKTKKAESSTSEQSVATSTVAASVEKPGLTRREREEVEKQQAKERYQKLHEAGKTDEAKADLARLALIKKQREDAAKKREDDKKVQDDAKNLAEKKLMEKKQKAI